MSTEEEFARAERRVLGAREAHELFGPAPGVGGEPGEQAARCWRALARSLHPDACPPGMRGRASVAFARLGVLWGGYRGAGGEQQVRIATAQRSYRVGALVARGDIANVYRVSYTRKGGEQGEAVMKIARSPGDSDLMAAEAHALARLESHGPGHTRAYVPRLVESFTHRDESTGARRGVTVMEPLAGFFTLAEVAAAYPEGVDARDAAWMWRRLLVALGHGHRAGLVHGAALGANVLVHPGEHGLVLADWCYSVRAGQPLAAMVQGQERWYGPEVAARGPATAATDIFTATRTIEALVGTRMPPRLAVFARGCALANPAARPGDAWALLEELDEVLEELWGPRRWRPFAMPAGAAAEGVASR
ncbi:molecular chaperone DnaJ [Nocardiopsis ansamitocini]|uniref:Protein kinase domain-containing protein n=1 Tax=Nocardiopsis ansamitocini TaxID=1670832 RepID=A0A9W6UGX2_9ACTN|nr:molecular chaperone DnaJ [Nocardiopsis ansamitocini]GLU48196.1 hypothetical protein Nans01_25470 [Nocardiopsis ansamitocini]